MPLISLIIPCYNEEAYIIECIDSILACDYPKDQMEILLIDGMSTDRTRAIVQQYQAKYTFIQLLDNPQRIVPSALNIGIREAKGDYIIRLDAHCTYPENYFTRLIEEATRLNAENVGGVCNTLPSKKTAMAKAIAKGISHPLGVGNSTFRVGCKDIQEVDTVPFGCFPKKIFDKVGMFDLDLVRNQDDEFNARIKKHGGKIYIIPDLVIEYFSRDTLDKTYNMFYQYGLYKPLVNKKLGSPATIRQFVPLFFVLGIIGGFSLGAFIPVFLTVTLLAMFLYLIITTFIGFLISKSIKDYSLILYMPVVFFTLHFAYGWGYIKGIIHFFILDNNNIKVETNR